ncbi:hypothetical protein OBBRIDRAFT_36099 [Obba rivulosa]|uniref:Uncharacterized protein n=1 Tax=Obba rivulosa TaxID=1052685 RepID=A0A8E2DKS9_9APHY|nr:hypothetical protein OBBRIDRAFT_36099 [Obba rivulosa]
MNEPHYVALIFDRICLACGIGRAANVSYSLGVRFYSACYKRNVRLERNIPLLPQFNFEPLRYVGYKMIPCAVLEGDLNSDVKPQRQNNKRNFYSESEYRLALARLKLMLDSGAPLDDITQFVSVRERYADEMYQTGYALAKWSRSLDSSKAEKNEAPREKRRTDIEAQLRELGYLKEDFPDADHPERL